MTLAPQRPQGELPAPQPVTQGSTLSAFLSCLICVPVQQWPQHLSCHPSLTFKVLLDIPHLVVSYLAPWQTQLYKPFSHLALLTSPWPHPPPAPSFPPDPCSDLFPGLPSATVPPSNLSTARGMCLNPKSNPFPPLP